MLICIFHTINIFQSYFFSVRNTAYFEINLKKIIVNIVKFECDQFFKSCQFECKIYLKNSTLLFWSKALMLIQFKVNWIKNSSRAAKPGTKKTVLKKLASTPDQQKPVLQAIGTTAAILGGWVVQWHGTLHAVWFFQATLDWNDVGVPECDTQIIQYLFIYLFIQNRLTKRGERHLCSSKNYSWMLTEGHIYLH